MNNFLDPNILRNHLVFISLFIAAFEFTKDIIISKPKSFFMIGYEDKKLQISPDYEKHILSRNKSPLYASLDWFKENSAINTKDIEIFNRIKIKRNEAVHEMMALIQNGPTVEFEQSFTDLINLLNKIEKWWFSEIELAISIDLDANSIDLDEVLPGSVLTIQILNEVAMGNEEERNRIFEEYLKQTTHAE